MYNLFLNPISEEDDIQASDDVNIKLEKSGYNTGNLVFVDAVKKQMTNYIKGGNIYSEYEYKDNLVVSGVIPASNWLNTSNKVLECVAGFVKKQKFPITLVGLGSQSTKILDTPRKIVDAMSKETITAMNIIADHCKTIGIRGEFTAECLELLGIRNFRIIGCPSVYKQVDGIWHKQMRPKKGNFLININTGSKLGTDILNAGIKENAKWIMQTTNEFPQMISGDFQIGHSERSKKFPGFENEDDLYAYAKKNAQIFYGINEWEKYLTEGQFTFSFGSRFHGNMMAFRSNIPTLWITHDSRTEELTKAMFLPRIDLETFVKMETIEELMYYCNYTEFEKNFLELSRNYKAYLDENLIENQFEC